LVLPRRWLRRKIGSATTQLLDPVPTFPFVLRGETTDHGGGRIERRLQVEGRWPPLSD
jgi:hypothetical protein